MEWLLYTLALSQPVEEGPPGAVRDASLALTECLAREGDALAAAPGSLAEKLNSYLGRCREEQSHAVRAYAAERPHLAGRAGAWALERYLIFARRTFLPRVIHD